MGSNFGAIFVSLYISSLGAVSARDGFVKDLSMNVAFPPLVRKTSSGIPEGHLRPLGYQRNPEGQIDEETDLLKPQEFNDRYVRDGRPVVFRKAVPDSPALTKWGGEEGDKYLLNKYGNLDMHVTVKKEVFKSGPKRMKFSQFLKDYMYENWYLATTVPQEMMSELTLPKCLECGTFRKYLQEAELWMSSGGTASLLHYHADHNLHCVLSGRKDFILIHPEYQDGLDVEERHPHSGSGFSKMDMDQVNVFKNPEVAQTPWTFATLKPGDCIYVPAGYLHQVRSYGRSISSTVLWAPTLSFDSRDCLKVKEGSTLLSDCIFTWTYYKGDKVLYNAKLNANSLKHHLLSLLRTQTSLHYDRFAEFYEEVMSEMDDFPDADEVFTIMSDGALEIPRDRIIAMDTKTLEKVAKILNKPQEDNLSKSHAGHSHDEL